MLGRGFVYLTVFALTSATPGWAEEYQNGHEQLGKAADEIAGTIAAEMIGQPLGTTTYIRVGFSKSGKFAAQVTGAGIEVRRTAEAMETIWRYAHEPGAAVFSSKETRTPRWTIVRNSSGHVYLQNEDTSHVYTKRRTGSGRMQFQNNTLAQLVEQAIRMPIRARPVVAGPGAANHGGDSAQQLVVAKKVQTSRKQWAMNAAQKLFRIGRPLK